MYPALRALRKVLFFLTPTRVNSYNSAELAEKIVSADLENLAARTSFSCKLWQLSIADKRELRVLDFGGGSGRCGFERMGANNLAWAVVETQEMAAAAERLIKSPSLMFFDSVERAQKALGRVDVVHVSSALQYSVSPITTFIELLQTQPDLVLLEKTVVSRKEPTEFRQYSFLRDNLTGRTQEQAPEFGAVRYWLYAANQNDLFDACERFGYQIVTHWEDPIQSHLPIGKGLHQIGLVALRKSLRGEDSNLHG